MTQKKIIFAVKRLFNLYKKSYVMRRDWMVFNKIWIRATKILMYKIQKSDFLFKN